MMWLCLLCFVSDPWVPALRTSRVAVSQSVARALDCLYTIVKLKRSGEMNGRYVGNLAGLSIDVI